MPTYPIQPNEVVEIRWNATLFGQSVMFVTHYQASTGSPVTADLDNLLTAWQNDIWAGGLQTYLSDDVEAVFLQGQVVHPTRKIAQEKALTPTTGAIAEPALPPTSAVVVRKRTLTAGRAFRGRIFIPGLPFDNTQGGVVEPGTVGNLETWASNLAQPLTFGSRFANPVIFSTRDQAVRAVITNTDVDNILRVQRRREVGVGI